jgi:hypothetical protein
MSVFAEPSVTLCGHVEPHLYAVCCARAGDEREHANGHVMVEYVEVAQRPNSTFTPCEWASGPFKTDDKTRMW